MKFKKAAMFGLDARIALAIFGALSVISGAALYNAVSEAKMESYRQIFEEINKASDHYYLDTGEQLPLWVGSSGRTRTAPLVSNTESLSSWNGPYIQGNIHTASFISNSITSNLSNDSYLSVFLHKSDTWLSNASYQGCLIDDINCAEYIAIEPSSSAIAQEKMLDLFNKMDNYIDGGDGALAGTVRFTTVDRSYLLYKGRFRKRTF